MTGQYITIYPLLPPFLKRILFGDRVKFGKTPDQNDPCWHEWESKMAAIFTRTQKRSIGQKINNAGYKVMSKISLAEKNILEIGPSYLEHSENWNGLPSQYTIADIRHELLDLAEEKLKEKKVSACRVLLDREKGATLPFKDNEFDLFVSFYTLEHLYPIDSYLKEIKRVVKPGGMIIGGIPAEGGLAWGLGRAITSRRYFKKNTTINPDKIICWEHPNFTADVMKALDMHFERQTQNFWPAFLPITDINLIISFIYQNTKN